MQLLNTNESNTKIRKSASGTEYRIASLSLYPDILTCPGSALANCMDACLKSAGRGCMQSVVNARQSKTDLYHSDPERFFELLNDQLFAFERSCARQGKTPLARLNTISDIPYEKQVFKYDKNEVIREGSPYYYTIDDETDDDEVEVEDFLYENVMYQRECGGNDIYDEDSGVYVGKFIDGVIVFDAIE